MYSDNLNGFETCWIKMKTNNNFIIIGTLYVAPKRKTSWISVFETFLNKIMAEHKNDLVILCGDFNVNWKDTNKYEVRQLQHLMNFLGLIQKVDFVTHHKSTIDLLFVNEDSEKWVNCKETDNLISTHRHVGIEFEIYLQKDKSIYSEDKNLTYYYDYSGANFSKINEELGYVLWSNLNGENIDSYFKLWYDTIMNIIQKNCEKKMKNNFNNRPKWITDSIIALNSKKREIYRECKNNSINTSFCQPLKQIQETLNQELNHNMSNYLDSLVDKNLNITKICNLIKNKKNNFQNIFNINGSDTEDVDTILKAFELLFCKEDSSKKDDLNNSNEELTEDLDINLNMNDLFQCITLMEINKACGPFSIPPKILRECHLSLVSPIFYLFKKILSFGKFPRNILTSEVKPILKPGKPKNKVDSYRPIAISSNIMTIFDKLQMRHIARIIDDEKYIPDQQFGFRRNRSCDLLLIVMLHKIYMALDDKKTFCYDLISLDFTDAFGSVDHQTLIQDFKDLEIGDPYIYLMKAELNNRYQYVQTLNRHSVKSKINKGVIQGGIKSPVQYNVYVRDLPKEANIKDILQYCDDTNMGNTISVMNSKEDIEDLQLSLNRVYYWAKDRKLNLNPSKSVHLRFYNKQSKVNTKYTINELETPTYEFTRILGLILDDKLSFHKHIENMIARSNKIWYSLWKNIKYARCEVLKRLFYTYIIPIIEQLNMVWTPSISQYNDIERIQRRCTKQIVFKNLNTRNMNYIERLNYLNLDSTWSRYKQKKALLIFDIRNGRYYDIQCLKDLITFTFSRNGSMVLLPRTRLFRTDRSPILDAARVFNGLPRMIRDTTVRSEFKSKVKQHFNEEFKTKIFINN